MDWRKVALLALLAPGACGIPRDPRGTLEEVRGDTLRVGLTEAAPWVVREGEEARGVEAELVRRFARDLGAEVGWRWGSTEEHMAALETYDLDVVIGGYSATSPWRRHVGLTAPYHVSRVRAASPPGSAPVTREAMEGREVAVPPGGAIAARVREKGGIPRPAERLADARGLVAAPDWTLLRLGRDTLGVVLATHRHVMAVPPGENGFLMALENSLHGADVAALLRDQGGRP